MRLPTSPSSCLSCAADALANISVASLASPRSISTTKTKTETTTTTTTITTQAAAMAPRRTNCRCAYQLSLDYLTAAATDIPICIL